MTADKRKEILSKAKQILFNTEMVRAVLDGRKTVTRRKVKNNPEECTSKVVNGVCKICDDKGGFYLPDDYVKARSPYNVGDILYVRETWCKGSLNYGIEQYYYKADDKIAHCRWEPSSRMPKEAARIFLKVTNVHVERLQDINDEEALKEGCGYFGTVDWVKEPLPDFRDTWNSTVKKKDLSKYGWDANPWVWVIEFERIG